MDKVFFELLQYIISLGGFVEKDNKTPDSKEEEEDGNEDD
jgi:hypothetical protein